MTGLKCHTVADAIFSFIHRSSDILRSHQGSELGAETMKTVMVLLLLLVLAGWLYCAVIGDLTRSFVQALLGDLGRFISKLTWKHITSSLLCVLLALYRRRAKRRAREAEHWRQLVKRNGCDPIPSLPKKGFLGFGWLIDNMKANKMERGPMHLVESLDKEMGKSIHTCIVPIGDYQLIVTRDPENVQAILASNSADWDVGEHRTASWSPLVGHGVFTTRGEEWKVSRLLVRPQFSKDAINDLDLVERHVQELFEAIDEYMDGRPAVEAGWTNKFDLQPLFYNMTLDITTELIYGYSVHSQNPKARVKLPDLPGYPAPDRMNISSHMDAGKAWIETRGALWKYRWLLPSGEFKKHCEAVHRFADWFVQLRLMRGDAYLDGLADTGAPRKDRYVLLHELAKETQDPDELRGQTLNILLAGRDTTAALLGWIFYFLARHPRVFKKLREEILEQFGPYSPTKPSGLTDFGKLRGLYLNAVINESLRVAPVIPLNERVALRDTKLPRGGHPNPLQPIMVPKGTQVLISTYAMTRREDIWGPNVDEFRPERWIEKGGRKFGFEFIPFGGGVRQCLGRKLRTAELPSRTSTTCHWSIAD